MWETKKFTCYTFCAPKINKLVAKFHIQLNKRKGVTLQYT